MSEAGGRAEPAPALPAARVEHRLPGRVRLRVMARRGDAGFFARTVERLRALPGVRAARANRRTGSILVEHDGGDLRAIAEAAAREGLFQVEPPARPGVRTAGLAPAPDPMSLVAASFAVLALVQGGRGQVAGSASESLWNAYGAYAQLRRPGLALGLAALGAYRLIRGPRLSSAAALLYYALSAREQAARRGGADRPSAGPA